MVDRHIPHNRRPGQPKVNVFPIAGELGLTVVDRTAPGTALFDIEGQLTVTPTRYTVQIGHNVHVDLPPGDEWDNGRFFWRFMNHSCQPTAIIRERRVIALTALDPGEEITFNYNTTEYAMAEPFDCRCASPECAGVIRGFRFVPSPARWRLRPWLADHLAAILDGRRPEPAGTSGGVR